MCTLNLFQKKIQKERSADHWPFSFVSVPMSLVCSHVRRSFREIKQPATPKGKLLVVWWALKEERAFFSCLFHRKLANSLLFTPFVKILSRRHLHLLTDPMRRIKVDWLASSKWHLSFFFFFVIYSNSFTKLCFHIAFSVSNRPLFPYLLFAS